MNPFPPNKRRTEGHGGGNGYIGVAEWRVMGGEGNGSVWKGGSSLPFRGLGIVGERITR
jgi:hypothetical protein